MNLGLFEGHNWDEILSMYAEEHKQWMSNKRYNRAPNGESYQMVMERLFRALDHIFEYPFICYITIQGIPRAGHWNTHDVCLIFRDL